MNAASKIARATLELVIVEHEVDCVVMDAYTARGCAAGRDEVVFSAARAAAYFGDVLLRLERLWAQVLPEIPETVRRQIARNAVDASRVKNLSVEAIEAAVRRVVQRLGGSEC